MRPGIESLKILDQKLEPVCYRADRAEIKKDQVTDKTLIVIKARPLSQAHDWKTVK